MKDALIETTKDLIRFKSNESRPEERQRCADYIEHYFSDTPLRVERMQNNGHESLVVTKGTKTPKVMLSGHYDVIDAQEEQFKPRQDGDKLYGRGALDMKGGDAVMMALVKEFAQTKHDVGLMLTGDEEIGGFDGTEFLLNQGYGCQIAIIPDDSRSVQRIVDQQKGVLMIEVRAAGKSVHGSRPWEGENALLKLVDALKIIEGKFVSIEKHPEGRWTSTCNIGSLHGGDAPNRVPDLAVAQCDLRLTPDVDPDELFGQIESSLPEGVEIRRKIAGSATSTPKDHPLVGAYVAALERHGQKAEFMNVHGNSDARFFFERGIPSIISQPKGGNNHGAGEWISISEIELYYEILKDYLGKVAI